MIARASSDHAILWDSTPEEKIEGRWTLQILLCLNGGELRFSELAGRLTTICPCGGRLLNVENDATANLGYPTLMIDVSRNWRPEPESNRRERMCSQGGS
jgi:hypothetical protein